MIQYFKYYKPGIGASWLLVGLTFVGSLLAGLTLSHAPQSLSYAVMTILPLAWCWWMGNLAAGAGEAPVAVNAPRFGKLGAAGFLSISAIALLALSVVIDPTTSFIPMPDSIKALFEKVFMNSPLWDMIVSTCILAPLFEEFLCRGMMLRGMLSGGMRPRNAILWSALLFAVLHMNPWQSIPAFLIGLLLGWVYWRTRCLWATIFLHFFNNSISTLISRLWPDLPIDAGLSDVLSPATWWIVFGVSAVVLILTLYLLHEKTVSPEVQTRVEA